MWPFDRKKREQARELRQKIELHPKQLWAIRGRKILDMEVGEEAAKALNDWLDDAPDKDAAYLFFLANSRDSKVRRQMRKHGLI